MIRFIRYDKGEPRVVTIPRWALGLGAVAAVLVGILILTLAAGIALVAIPVALVAGGIAAWIGRGKRVRQASAPQDPNIIDAEFRVIERKDRSERR
jgi:hypothetical protein